MIKRKQIDGLEDVLSALAEKDIHVYRTLTGTAAVTSSPYYCARWDVTDESVTEYRDGMVVCVKVPVAGNGSYGTGLQINSLGYKPVVYNVNSMIGMRYSVGSFVWAVYNATQTATLYLGSGSQTITGCWQVMDYNVDENFIDEPSMPTLPDGTVIEHIEQDYDGNWYDGVILGNQIWLAQNLRTTHYADGTAIPAGNTAASTETPFYYDYMTHNLPLEKRGLLYNQPAVLNGASPSNSNPSGVQGIAPNGWHVPSQSEFEQLISYLGSVPKYILNNNNTYIGKAIAATEGWDSSIEDYAVGNNLSQNNATNLTVYGAGVFDSSDRIYRSENTVSVFWTTRTNRRVSLVYNTPNITSSTLTGKYGCSVRCVCDLTASEWVSANINRFYLKYTANGAVWSLLSEVAESGSYNDLKDKPTVPTNVSGLNNDAGYLTANDVPVEVFVCNYNATNNTMDKTVSEIYAAYNAGNAVICKSRFVAYYLELSSSTTCIFRAVINTGNMLSFRWIKYDGGAWSTRQYDLDSKQDVLVSSGAGQNIKTIMGASLLGAGNIDNVGVCYSEEYADALTASVDGFTLRDCAVAKIRFNNGIKVNENSTWPKTLNINNTGAKPLYVWGDLNNFTYGNEWLVSNFIVASVIYLAGSLNYSEGYYLSSTSFDLSRVRALLNGKLSASDLKTINNQSLVGSGNISTNEIFRCEIEAQLPYGNLKSGVTNDDVLAAVSAGKTVFCTLFDDETCSFTLLISTQGTPMTLTGTKIYNNLLYCFVATPVSGTSWYVQYLAK